jgi:hypothetical protein
MVVCPHCSLSNDSANLFCEQCGYDFTTGQAPPEPASAADVAPQPVDDSTVTWIVVVEVDRAWYELKGSLADQPCPPASSSTVSLAQRETLVGRSSQSRGIRPEIALDADTGVSRRHVQLVRTGDELAVVDLSSTNGTYVVSGDVEPGEDAESIPANVPTPLHDGDRVYLGAWTRLTMRRT